MISNYVMTKLAGVKSAGTVGTILRSMPTTMMADTLLPGSGHVADSIGSFSGMFTKNDDLDDLLKEEEDIGSDFIPGVAGRKLQRKKRVIENALKKKKRGNRTLSERLGQTTSLILPTLAGGVIGGLANKDDQASGALTGALIGGGSGALLNLLGAVGTNFTKGRDEEDLEKYYNSKGTSLANYLIPGFSGYNHWKNLMAADRVLKKYKTDPELRKKLRRALDE